MKRLTLLLPILACAIAPAVFAQEQVLNLYSARHYQTDEALYQNFTKQTGIRINRIEAGDDQLIERLKSEGANSPADVLLIVDAARLAQADDLGLFQPVKSKVLDERIPAELRDPEGAWFGLSSRARIIVYNKATMNPADVATYASLADPKNKGKVCTRSGSHPYNLSLMSAQIAHLGEATGRGLGEGRRREPGAQAPGRGHRPDQGGCRGRVRCGTVEQLLLRAAAALDQARGPRGGCEDRRGVARPGRSRARTSTSPVPACSGTPRTATTRSASSSTWRATRRRATSPTATTSGRR